jgi:hypothetical protein
VAEMLETLDLSENLFTMTDCLTIVRAVGNTGTRRTLKSVKLFSQYPELTQVDVLLIEEALKTISSSIRLNSKYLAEMSSISESAKVIFSDDSFEKLESTNIELMSSTATVLSNSFIKIVYL